MEAYGPALLRLFIGVTLAAHGAEAVRHLGGGLNGTAAHPRSDRTLPVSFAVTVAVIEFAGGLRRWPAP